jgi:beta-phosphoglucomutase-like phosphatase (HAD superfamily)
LAALAEPDLPGVEVTLVTYQRGPENSALAQAARQAGLPVATIAERRRRTMLRVLADAELRGALGAAAQARAEAHHAPEAYRRALVEFYRSTFRRSAA